MRVKFRLEHRKGSHEAVNILTRGNGEVRAKASGGSFIVFGDRQRDSANLSYPR
jgi:hypothetical protein